MTTTPTTSISKFDDIIDSRDVIARIEALEAEREALLEARNEASNALADPHATEDLEREAMSDAENTMQSVIDWDADWAGELASLKALASEAEGYSSDWRWGSALIRDSYFETYAQELAEDCDMLPKDARWPMTCIDWKEAARELQQDYTSVDFDGVTFWIR